MEYPAATVPLFVYGSLRPGMALWPDIRDAVIEARPASVAGRLFWHEGGEWPLLVTDPDATVRGDLLTLRPGDAINRIIVDEELRYGYDARWMPVDVDGTQTDALVLVWNRTDQLGDEIVGGDYAEATSP
jgi:gamma-glutamylcyclotransferase (GGCT)/AIG2-like uncharacterized protein YtfP